MNELSLEDGDQSNSSSRVNEKRQGYIEWSEYFMAVAFLAAQRSKDPVSQVGACIVSRDKKIVGTGYNGMPNGCHDDLMPWGKHKEDELENKYMYVCHAEMNAILNKNCHDISKCTIYTCMFPCNECAKIIIQSGISEVVFMSDKHRDKSSSQAARRMFDQAGVVCKQFCPSRRKITIDFDALDHPVGNLDNNNNNNNNNNTER